MWLMLRKSCQLFWQHLSLLSCPLRGITTPHGQCQISCILSHSTPSWRLHGYHVVIMILISCCKAQFTLLTSAAAAASSQPRLLVGNQVSIFPPSFSAGGRRVLLPVRDFQNNSLSCVIWVSYCEWRQYNIQGSFFSAIWALRHTMPDS